MCSVRRCCAALQLAEYDARYHDVAMQPHRSTTPPAHAVMADVATVTRHDELQCTSCASPSSTPSLLGMRKATRHRTR